MVHCFRVILYQDSKIQEKLIVNYLHQARSQDLQDRITRTAELVRMGFPRLSLTIPSNALCRSQKVESARNYLTFHFSVWGQNLENPETSEDDLGLQQGQVGGHEQHDHVWHEV